MNKDEEIILLLINDYKNNCLFEYKQLLNHLNCQHISDIYKMINKKGMPKKGFWGEDGQKKYYFHGDGCDIESKYNIYFSNFQVIYDFFLFSSLNIKFYFTFNKNKYSFLLPDTEISEKIPKVFKELTEKKIIIEHYSLLGFYYFSPSALSDF